VDADALGTGATSVIGGSRGNEVVFVIDSVTGAPVSIVTGFVI
jgi:hypothetical protein